MLDILVVEHEGPALQAVKTLFQEYQAFLGIPLNFQNFEAELATLPGKFAPPDGRLYLARWNGEIAGCVAFYCFAPCICELKRLFVRPAFQGCSIGKALMERAMQDAAELGYGRMRLDSLHRLEAAEKMYHRFGFYKISPYNENPHSDVYYMERALKIPAKHNFREC